MNFKTNISYKNFRKKLEALNDEANNINRKEFKRPERLKEQIEEWERKVIELLEDNIEPNPTNLIRNFREYKRDNFILFELKKKSYISDKQEQIEYIKFKFKNTIESFEVLMEYLSITYPLKEGKIVEINTIEEKILFILDKLYELFSDKFYSVQLILETNEIEFREDEPIEIAKDLIRRGYAIRESEYIENDLIKISVKGATYTERKKKSTPAKNTKLTEENLNKKIDKVLEELKHLGYGQEIIFDEIEDLREDYKNLSKKSFSQLVKGKVVDLALSNVISSEAAKMIYESIVDHKFKLLP